MIQSHEDYLNYSEADRISRGEDGWSWRRRFTDEIWLFQRLLRKMEYYENCKRSTIDRYLRLLLRYRFHDLSVRLGFTIPTNVFGPGLCIRHRGTIVVHKNARVGENCKIHQCVTIGQGVGAPKAPQIGNNVFIAPGAVLLGDITIADGIAVGANAVVLESFLEPGITIGGIPARKISGNGSDGLLIRATEVLRRQVKQEGAEASR